MLGNRVDAAHEPRQVVSGQTQDQVDARGDAARLQPLRPGEHAPYGRRPVHAAQRRRVGGLQADFEPVEAGRGEPIGQFVVDRFGPDFAEKPYGAIAIQAGDFSQQPLEPGPHVQTRIQQVNLPDAALDRPGHGLQHLPLLYKRDLRSGFVVEAESAAVRASALRFQEHQVFELGLEQPGQVGALRRPEDIAPRARPPGARRPGARVAQQPPERGLPFPVNEAIDPGGSHPGIVGGDLGPAEDDAGAAPVLQPVGQVQAALQVPAEDGETDHVRPLPGHALQKGRVPQVRRNAFGQDLDPDAGDVPGRKLQARRPERDVPGLQSEGVARDRQLQEKDAHHRAVTRGRPKCRPAPAPRRPPPRTPAGPTGKGGGWARRAAARRCWRGARR